MPDAPAAAFSRNIGILTTAEQEKLARSTIAIAGLGGVGGKCIDSACAHGRGRFPTRRF